MTSSFTGFVAFDLETTGLSPAKHHRIIELGIVRLDEDFDVVEEWQTLINPERDIGESGIHGLTATDLVEAPTFKELLADIWHRFEGAIPVAHNFTFDRSFITAEFARNGVELNGFDGLCTMRLASANGLAPGMRRLVDICKALAIDILDNHCAGNDARMCAEILRRLGSLTDLSSMCQPVTCPELWKRQATPLGICRKKARERPIESPLQILSGRLSACCVESKADKAALDEYLLVLDRVLEDRVVEEDEANELASLAGQLGISADDIEQVHKQYVAGLVGLVLNDGIVTEDERRDLERVAGLLGVSSDDVKKMLEQEERGDQFMTEDLSGKTVFYWDVVVQN